MMNLNLIIAANLKRLRQERNFSLGQLGELAGVSKVMLAQIEKGETNPTINTIWKIANGLKVPYTVLIDEPETAMQVITKKDTAAQISEDRQYRIYCYYSTNQKRNFELFTMELDSAATYTSVGHSEKSLEYILVLEGELVLKTGNNSYILKPEESLCFASAAPHTYSNSGTSMVKAVIINFYPVG
jgi:transcriptional regulator with XRE-family HTH domain